MIETTQSVTVAAPLDATWTYARDVQRWAEIMPGYQSCEIVDDDNSLWVLKVGVGGLVRTVSVSVQVERWAGPQEVDFTFRLQGDPVEGSGSYRASRTADGRTQVSLAVQVHGAGPMAPMWEAMGAPVLPRFARGFAEELRDRIETQAGCAPDAAATPAPSIWARLAAWFGGLLHRETAAQE